MIAPKDRIPELFGRPTTTPRSPDDWRSIIAGQQCPYLRRPCIKTRKSEPEVAIGTCVVGHGRRATPLIICPHRYLEQSRVFADCFHLLKAHEPGNEFHVVSEFDTVGGSIDYMLVSARRGQALDYAGIEFQSLDTTGTVWPTRQELLRTLGLAVDDQPERPFGVNWKMTAKTILMQLHHKIAAFQAANRHLVLVIQDELLRYLQREFRFGHFSNPASLSDALHVHAYQVERMPDGELSIALDERLSTTESGLSVALALRDKRGVEADQILSRLSEKMSAETLLRPAGG